MPLNPSVNKTLPFLSGSEWDQKRVSSILFLILLLSFSHMQCTEKQGADATALTDSAAVAVIETDVWRAPDSSLITNETDAELILYGKALIAHTSQFLGPNGSVSRTTNGMNCQNCHLQAGAKPFGNNYSAVYSTYPKFRSRSASVETIEKRVNDCIQRSLNGNALDSSSREMRAIVAYMKWLGRGVPKGTSPKGVGLVELKFLGRPADPQLGKVAYEAKCVTCHGLNGQGQMAADGKSYTYPPLWGPHSYNIGAGLYRLSRFAGYIKANMPYGTNYLEPQLTDEEAWDIAAYVNSMDRPVKDYSGDWPDSSKKPIDHPFGPYADPFSEQQHKYGPFAEIKSFYKKE